MTYILPFMTSLATSNTDTVNDINQMSKSINSAMVTTSLICIGILTSLIIFDCIRIIYYVYKHNNYKIPSAIGHILLSVLASVVVGLPLTSQLAKLNKIVYPTSITIKISFIAIITTIISLIFLYFLLINIVNYQNFETFLHSTIREYAILMTIYAGCITVITHKFVLAISAFIIVIADLILLKLPHKSKEIQKND